jgi:hypothetical protein
MNHLAARQRKTDKRWDYTSDNKRTGTYPIGYCHALREMKPEIGFSQEMCDRYNTEEQKFASKYHKDGHATKEEACECYRQYELDHTLRFEDDNPDASTLHKCEECGTFTSGSAHVGAYVYWRLCAEHRTREQVEKRFTVGEAWQS